MNFSQLVAQSPVLQSLVVLPHVNGDPSEVHLFIAGPHAVTVKHAISPLLSDNREKAIAREMGPVNVVVEAEMTDAEAAEALSVINALSLNEDDLERWKETGDNYGK